MRPPGAGSQVTLTDDEAAYALASLLAAADGKVTHAETRRIEGEWTRYAATRGLAPEKARAVAAHCRDLRASIGAKALSEACERTLRTSPHAREAVLMAVHVAYADGELAGTEKALLGRILTLVGLSADALPPRTGTPSREP